MNAITAKELKNLITKNPNLCLLDVRDEWEFDTCHIEGSENISMADIASLIDSLEKDCEIVIICHHGNRSLQAAGFLKQQGFEDIIILSGGIHAWATDVDPSMPQY